MKRPVKRPVKRAVKTSFSAGEPAQTPSPACEPKFSRNEIAQLAYLNWEADGCPPGQDLDYWLEAESQLNATWHLLAAATAAAEAAKTIHDIQVKEVALTFSSNRP